MKKLLITLGALTIASISFGKEVVAPPVVAQEPVVYAPTPVIVPSEVAEVILPGEYQNLASLPSYTISAPSGLVASKGVIFGGASFRTNKHSDDASLAMGMGFGDAYNSIGGSATLGIGSVDPRDGGAFNRGALDLVFGHNFSEYGLGIAVGATNINLWRATSADQKDASFYTSVTKLLSNDYAPVIVTAGLGNNEYVSYKRGENFRRKIEGFGAVAVYVHPQVSLIADYTAGLTAAGVSFVPVKTWPVNITLAYDDIFEQSYEEKSAFLATVSAAYTF